MNPIPESLLDLPFAVVPPPTGAACDPVTTAPPTAHLPKTITTAPPRDWVVEAIIVGAVLALAAGVMDLVAAICSGAGVDALSFPAPANDEDSDSPMQMPACLFWGYLWLVLNMVVVEAFRAVQLLACGRRVSWTNSCSRALLRRFRAAFSPAQVEACVDHDTAVASTRQARETSYMCELGLDDLAFEYSSADDENTWQQALSSGLVDASTAISDTSDDDWNTSLAEVESMMTQTNVDGAWDSHELSMTEQLVQVSTHPDHTTVDEWEDTSLVDGGAEADAALVGTPRRRMSRMKTTLLFSRAWSQLTQMTRTYAPPRTHIPSHPRGRHSEW
jgi:hypothetical protein